MITIDTRIGSRELYPLFPKGTATLAHLDYADVTFLGNGPDGTVKIGIERKQILDLLASMSSGRLSGHQLPGLLNDYDIVYLIVEGLWRSNLETGFLEHYRRNGWMPVKFGSRQFTGKGVYNFLNTLTIQAGVHVVRTSTLGETVQAISALHHWWVDKKWEEHRSHLAMSRTGTKTKAGLLRRMAAELPGIGWGKSLAVSRHFKSVAEMVLAGRKEWLQIEGIGKKIASDAMEVLYGADRDKQGA